MYTKKQKKLFILIVEVVAVCVVAVVAAGYFFRGSFAPYPAGEAVINPYADKPVSNISGVVAKVDGGSVTLSVYQPNAASRTVIARVSAGTEVFKIVPKDSTPESPLPYTKKAVRISDVQVGESVIVAVPPGTKLGASDVSAVSIGVFPR